MKTPNYLFSINHITNESSTKRIYGIRLNNKNYFLGKTSGIVDCEQLDTNPKIAPDVFKAICDVITELENSGKRDLSIDEINKEIAYLTGKKNNPKA